MFTRTAVYGAILMFMPAGQPAAASKATEHVADAVGRVLDPAPVGDPMIVRADGRRVPARFPAVLYSGDRVEVPAGREVGIVLRGKRTKLAAMPTTPLSYAVSGGSERVSPFGRAILESLADFLVRPRQGVSTPILARGPDGGDVAVSADPLLPAGRQWLPPTVTSIALIWKGPVGAIEIAAMGSEAKTTPAYSRSWAIFPLIVPPGSDAEIALQGTAVRWQIGTSGKIPLSPGQAAGDTTAGGRDRLARAIWLLRDGPVEWRIFALSEIADLAGKQDFVAAELWKEAQDGNLGASLGRGTAP